MSTLYRLYRPQKFADVTGQEHIIQTITNEICAAKTAHAYLFSGPRGTGKTTLARLLAKAVNCQNREEGEFEPCDQCSSCAEISAGNNIDVMEIDAASHTGVENVRENIIDNAQFQPTKSKFKVFIIDEVHMLSASAFNALLKTLEEPPKHVIFVLATTELQKLPATIVSRCQRFAFKKIGFDQMMGKLLRICKDQDVKIDKKVLERVINKSDGCMRDAESLLGQILTLNLKDIKPEDAEMILPSSNAQSVLQFIDFVLNKKAKEAVEMVAQFVSEGVNLEQFAYDALEIMRLLMILKTDPTKDIGVDYGDEDVKTVRKMSKQITEATAVKMIDRLMARRAEMKYAPIPQLPLELFVVEFASNADDTNCHSERSPKGEVEESLNNTKTEIKEKTTLKAVLTDIKKKWSQLIDNLAAQNHSLGFILKMSDLARLEGRELRLSVPYSFHKDKLDEQKTKKIIEDELNLLFGEKILLTCEVASGENTKDEPELAQIASEFGGEIV